MAKPPPGPIYTLRGHTAPITALDFVEAEESASKWGPETPFPWLLSGSTRGEIFLWNLQTFRVESKVSEQGKPIVWLGHSNDCILSFRKDGVLETWKYESGAWKMFRRINGLSSAFCQCSLLSVNSSSYVAVCDEDMIGTVILNIETGQEICKVKPDENESNSGLCMCLKLSSSEHLENLLLCGYENGQVVAWDFHNKKALSSIRHKETVMCLDYDGVYKQQGISGSADNTLLVWTLSNQLELSEKKQITITNPGVSSLAIRPDGKVVVSGGWDGRLRYFSWKSLKPLAVLLNHNEMIQCLKFSSGKVGRYSQLLAAGSKDTKISLWNLYS